MKLMSLSQRVEIRNNVLKEVENDLEQGLLNEDTFSMIETILTHAPVYEWFNELETACGSYYNEVESTLRKYMTLIQS